MRQRFYTRAAGISLAALAVAVAFSGGERARAEPREPLAVVELFTSQGCSSCPPADALLEKYVKRRDVIALTYNVDYWDYLGWQDTLASPEHTTRQRAYAKTRGDGQVYTPQVVIGGIRHAVGSREAAIDKAIARTKAEHGEKRISLAVRAKGDTLVIKAGPAPEGVEVEPAATIWLALVSKQVTVEIERGENRGREITYFSVVRELTPIGQWTGEAVTIRLPKKHLMNNGVNGCAALLQQDEAGPILAAAELREW